MLKMIKDRKGFTLIELMVVVAILAILATMVAGGVTGSGTAGEKSQVASDASAMKSAVTAYQNAAINQSYPSSAIWTADSGTNYMFPAGMFTFAVGGVPTTDKSIPIGKLGALSPITSSVVVRNATTGAAETVVRINYEALIWNSATNVRQKQGGVAAASFVPDFLDAPPDSTRLLSGAGDSTNTSNLPTGKMLPEFLWVLKIGSALDADARSVQVYHLKEAASGESESSRKYERIYPKVQ